MYRSDWDRGVTHTHIVPLLESVIKITLFKVKNRVKYKA